MPLLWDGLHVLEKLVYRIEDMLIPSGKLPPEDARDEARLPSEGATISVEMALNSRCSSDYDGNPRKFHWGMFDRTKRLSEEQVGGIVELATIPRFTDGRMAIRADGNRLTFLVDSQATDSKREWLMVESGMQQQSVGLVCSALGVGMVMRNLGKDGTPVSDEEHATVKILLDAMKPSYRGSFWTDIAPTGRAGWLRGNLPDPVRDGQKPLLTALTSLTTKTRSSEVSTEGSMSQLLWAARGRTPHLYKSRPWGMTIPSWGGEQNISSVYAISDHVLSEYANWIRNRPTHTLVELKSIGPEALSPLSESHPQFDRLIVIGGNEDHSRSLWEVGYQLLNILVQANALDIPYEAALLDENRKRIFRSMGIKNPVAIMML